MLTFQQLVEMERGSRGVRTLSVYIPAEARDPAIRHAWRTELDGRLAHLRAAIATASRDERERFERTLSHLRDHLAPFHGALRPVGYATFASADGVQHAARLPAGVPWLIAWEQGMRIAPYLRALKQLRPVVVALVDSRSARLFRYREEELELLNVVHAHPHVEPPHHMGAAPHERFKPNTRGRTGTDAAQRELRAATERMMRQVARRLVASAGLDAWVILGGTTRAARALAAAMPKALSPRVMITPGLHVRSSNPEIARHAAEGGAQLRRSRDLSLIAALLDWSGTHGRGVVSANATLHALAEGAVQELLLTPRFLAEHPDEAELAVRAAMDQHATIEIVSDAPAHRLDAEAGGVGALLRFAAQRPGAITGAG